MNKQNFHHITRIVMLLIGLLFFCLIGVLIYNTVVVCAQNYCRPWLNVPVRLLFLIICYYIAGLCGWLPFHNRLRPNILPQPFFVWKCMTNCFRCIQEQWHRLRYRMHGYEGFYNMSLNNEIRQYFQDQIENLRNITNQEEENQANDTAESPRLGFISYRSHGKSAPIDIPEVKGRCKTLLKRENDRANFRTRPGNSQVGALRLEKPREFSDSFGSNTPESEGSAHPSSRSEDIFPFESDETERDEDEHLNEAYTESSDQCNVELECNIDPETGKIYIIRIGNIGDVPDVEQGSNILPEGASGVDIGVKQDASIDPSYESLERVHSVGSRTLEQSRMYAREEAILYSCSEAASASNVRVSTRVSNTINDSDGQNKLVNISEEARQIPERDIEGGSRREEDESKRIVDRLKQDDIDSFHRIMILRYQGNFTEHHFGIDSSNTKTKENVNSEQETSAVGISQTVTLSEAQREIDGSSIEKRTKDLNVSSSGLSGSSKKPKGSSFSTTEVP